MNASRALLTSLVDYAGLFPPASSGMEEAVRNYNAHLNSGEAWMLGRFVLPAGRLPEFEESFARLGKPQPWRLSVLATGDDAASVADFNARNAAHGGPKIDALELKAGTGPEIQAARASFGPSVALFFETPPDATPDLLPAMASAEAYAKIRTGGITSHTVPGTEEVFNFLQSTIATGVPFKATAGLHHALRGERPLTYAPDSPRATMHGFVNVFTAAVVLYNRINDDDAVSILNETDPGAFVFNNDELRWRDRVTLAGERIAEARRLALGFGSCSFAEPVADVREFGWL